MTETDLFRPCSFNGLRLKNRIVLSPLTRTRAAMDGRPGALQATYYAQRASAGLLITEATAVAPEGRGGAFIPGLWDDAHVAAWRLTTEAVHAKGGLIFCQLWHAGRLSHSSLDLQARAPVAPSVMRQPGKVFTEKGFVDYDEARALTLDEMPGLIDQYRQAARRAKAAGFDGVELHAAHSYLIDSFLRDMTNHRADAYGGSIENRTRLMVEVLGAILETWDPGHVAVRLAPIGHAYDAWDSDPEPLFTHVVEELNPPEHRLAGHGRGRYGHFPHRRAQLRPAEAAPPVQGSLDRQQPLRPRPGDRSPADGHRGPDRFWAAVHRQSRPGRTAGARRTADRSRPSDLLRWRGAGLYRLSDPRRGSSGRNRLLSSPRFPRPAIGGSPRHWLAGNQAQPEEARMTQESTTNTVLIAGASGVIGAAAVEHFGQMPGWKVIGVSRRRADVPDGLNYEHVTLDLQDAEACRAAASRFTDVTHVVYAALFEKPGAGIFAGWREQDQMQTNLAMMENLMGPLRRAAKGLTHVSVLQGTKAYGAHVHAIAVPARENRPRDNHENFYWLQEDYIRAAQKADGWSFTIWRPQVVFGLATGVALNAMPVLAAYAAICRELGLPLRLPGEQPRIIEAVDADLIARALAWSAQAPIARNETYNITNGDIFVWENVWPAIAETVGLEPAYGEAFSIAEFMPEHAEVWERIVVKHGLKPIGMTQLLGQSHYYADLLFQMGSRQDSGPTLVSTIKVRQAGFGDCVDTEEMFRTQLRQLADRKVVPQP